MKNHGTGSTQDGFIEIIVEDKEKHSRDVQLNMETMMQIFLFIFHLIHRLALSLTISIL